MKTNQIVNFPEEKIIKINKREERDYVFFELTINENDLNKIFNETKLTQEEYIKAVESFISAEKDDWTSLKMKEQIEMTTSSLIEKVLEKHAIKEYKINFEKADIKDIFYEKEKESGKQITIMNYVFKR